MSRILVGSSNVKRFYSHSGFKSYQPYKMELCTVFRMFEVTMESIPADARIVVSVVENFIEKEIYPAKEEEKLDRMKKAMSDFMGVIVKAAKKNVGAKLVVAYPLRRPANKWMTDNEEMIKKEFELVYNRQDQVNISKADCILWSSQAFNNNGVHLTKEAGQSFVENLLGMAEDNFEAEVINVEDGDLAEKIVTFASGSTEARSEKGGVAINELKRSMLEMRQWRDNFASDINKRFRNDNVMFARMREEMDAETNRKKEDRTLVAGCVDPTLMPKDGKERNSFLKQLATDFCKKLNPQFDGEVQFTSASGRPDKGNLMLEFKLDSVEKAREIGKMFAQMRVAGSLPESFGKLQVMTVITQATKVRLEIMKAIARLVDSETKVGYVPTYLPRPILHVKGKVATGPRRHIRSLTFTDSIEQYGMRLGPRDLSLAYEKAAWNFQGQMRQNFVVLHDREESVGPARSPSLGRGAWRGRGGARTPTSGSRSGVKRPLEGYEPEGKVQKR
jgi:hypothetical protein